MNLCCAGFCKCARPARHKCGAGALALPFKNFYFGDAKLRLPVKYYGNVVPLNFWVNSLNAPAYGPENVVSEFFKEHHTMAICPLKYVIVYC